MASAATGATPGTVAAFNADTNNRPLHVDQTDACKRRAFQLTGVEGKSADVWEIELAQQLLRQNDRSYAGLSESAQARTVLADLQRATGVSMSAKGTPAYETRRPALSNRPATQAAACLQAICQNQIRGVTC